MAGKIG